MRRCLSWAFLWWLEVISLICQDCRTAARLQGDNIFDHAVETFEDSEASVTTSCNICGDGGTLSRPNGVIITAQVFATCDVVQANPSLIPLGFCASIQQSSLIAAECGCTNPAQTCPVCGSGTLTNPNGIITSAEIFGPCGVINNNQRVIPGTFCPIVQSSVLIADECGCVGGGSDRSCPICGDDGLLEPTNPTGVIALAGVVATCEFIDSNPGILPAGTCVSFQTAALNDDTCGCRSPILSTSAPGSAPGPIRGFFQSFFARIFGD